LTSLPPGEVLAPADPLRYLAPRHTALRRVVSTFWTTAMPVSARVVRVLPDAAVDLEVTGGRVGIAGPDTCPSVERLPAGAVLGVQLRPEAVPAVLGVPASALVNTRVDLEEVWGPAGRDLGEQVRAARSSGQVVDLAERALVRRTLAETITPSIGSLRAQLAAGQELDVRRLGLSERQLRRRCVAAYGYGPSLLARVMRFQAALDLLRTPASGSLAEVAVLAGYVDQSHLSHDVGEFSGLTPAALRRTLVEMPRICG
jgi:AraC-like DNA-binding protein